MDALRAVKDAMFSAKDSSAYEAVALEELPTSSPPPRVDPLPHPTGPSRGFVFWILVNCMATLAIVLANKRILSNPTMKGAPTLFVAYHFCLTSFTLLIASSRPVGAFERKAVPLLSILPLAVVFAGHTVITNWSLALLDVVIYQELRILLTPATVIINFLAYQKTLAFRLVVALTVVCLGIGITIQSETLRTLKSGTGAAVDDIVKNTYLGYLAGLVGVALGAIYTVWLAVYLPKLQVTSMQLLYRQAPMACALLLVLTPFLDTMPVWSAITGPEWGLLALSGVSAVLINVSQFFIVAQSSAVSSTVVGHGKTIMIVAIGWMTAAKTISLQSGAGIIMALAGIVSYSYLSIMQK